MHITTIASQFFFITFAFFIAITVNTYVCDVRNVTGKQNDRVISKGFWFFAHPSGSPEFTPGYCFLFRSEIFFRTTRELEYLFFLSEFNIRLYDKNSESDYFFFLHQNQNILFRNIGNQNICLEKKHNPRRPLFKLNGRSLIEKTKAEIVNTWTCCLFLIS